MLFMRAIPFVALLLGFPALFVWAVEALPVLPYLYVILGYAIFMALSIAFFFCGLINADIKNLTPRR